MQKLRKFEDDYIFYLPLDDLHVILGYSLKPPKLGTKFISGDCLYVVCRVDVDSKDVICKHA